MMNKFEFLQEFEKAAFEIRITNWIDGKIEEKIEEHFRE